MNKLSPQEIEEIKNEHRQHYSYRPCTCANQFLSHIERQDKEIALFRDYLGIAGRINYDTWKARNGHSYEVES